MKIQRRFTRSNDDVYSTVEWSTRASRIVNADGSVVFEMLDAEVPAAWSQLATDIMVSKYFRKAGVPEDGGPNGIPSPCEVPKGNSGTGVPPVIADEGSTPESAKGRAAGAQHVGRDARATGSPAGPEKSARQVIHRLAGCWRHWGEEYGYFDSAEHAQAFYDEVAHMLLHQMAAPNSPQWFNTGLHWAYGIDGPAQGHWIADHKTGRVTLAPDAYSHPQPHACFIQSISDDLVNEGGIMDLWVREARLFKYGSGTGTNFSTLRGEDERLSGGGKSSGLMSFLKIGDRAAGAIKSGGTTRRAAKMVCLDVDHPDVEQFINWKVREELKVAAMVEGMKHLGDTERAVAEKLGLRLDYDFNGEAYHTVSGQNSNNSVRLPDAFFDAIDNNNLWHLIRRTDGEIAKSVRARDLWEQTCYAAWRCADPGLQFDGTINAWHTCPAGGRINASNPCSEYMFLDNTACNLASINLLAFYDAERRVFDVEGFEHAVRLWTIVLELSVLMAAFPSKEIAERSWQYRTLGLGYANLGAMLMQAGIPYDSDDGRAICGAVTAILTGRSYAASAEIAGEQEPFPAFERNREAMLRVIRNHRRAAHGVERSGTGVSPVAVHGRDARATGLEDYEGLRIRPVPIDHDVLRRPGLRLANGEGLLGRVLAAWDDALALGERHGYRNAQVSVIAPTGTIGLLMDCDTTGVEPDFALTKFKKLAGGGYFKIANQSLRPALRALGYETGQIDDILIYVMGALSLDVDMSGPAMATEGTPASATFRAFLEEHGYTPEDLVEVENQLPTVFELSMAFNAWSMPERILREKGIDIETARNDSSFNGLKVLGLTSEQIDQLNMAICGTGTVEGAPHLKDEHLPVFDCANTCGTIGRRFIHTEGHIRMMAAAQPFVSGAISKTINLPHDATVEDIAASYRLSWELGLKANALYRDGCKLSQPLSTSSDVAIEDKTEEVRTMETALGEASTEAAEPASVMSMSSKSFVQVSANGGHDNGDTKKQLQSPPEQILAGSETETKPEPQFIERIVERIVERPLRRRLPDTRQSITHKFNVAGHEGYLIVGLYENGAPGELFITMAKEGSTIGGLMDSLGTAISVALQYGVPLASLVKKFEHQRFEPMGMTTNGEIPFAKSLVDYIFRWLGMRFLSGYREANTPNRNGSGTESSDREAPLRADINPDPPAPTMPATDAAKTTESTTTQQTEAPPKARAIATIDTIVAAERLVSQTSAVMSQANASLMGDAPACDVCGSITVRNGTCYKCFNCGNSMGCS